MSISPLRMTRLPGCHLRSLLWRIREPSFWLIQGAMLAVTSLHLLLEVTGSLEGVPGGESLRHVPVTLYLFPIVYAGLRYGIEGGMSTGVLAGLLSLPNLIVWHRESYQWVGEAIFLAFVVMLGLVISIPVEREYRERRRAERTSQRLRLVNQISTILSRSPRLDQALDSALTTMREVIGLEAARVEREGDRPRGAGDVAVPIEVDGRDLGSLEVRMRGGHQPSAEELDLLSAIAAQIGVAMDNERLRRREHDRLKIYAQRVTEAQEEERKRIARDLHDDLAQTLVVLCRGLEGIERESELSRGSPALEIVKARARAALRDVRRFGRDLRPQLLDDLGLVAALEWLVADLRDHTSIDAVMSVDGEPCPLPPATAVTLFRVAQEALKNVERHSGTETAQIRVDFADDTIRITVSDQGRGFSEPDGPAQGRFGLLGMEERMKLVGGRLVVRSVPGRGTSVAAELRLQVETDGSGADYLECRPGPVSGVRDVAYSLPVHRP